MTTTSAAVDGINTSDYDPSRDIDTWTLTRTFGSHHPEGCHVALVDGSVHFLSEVMDINVFRDLGARDDRAPLGGFNP